MRADSVPMFLNRHAGALAAASWLSARGLRVGLNAPWGTAIALDVVDQPAKPTYTTALDTRFHIAISSDEWGFFFCHQRRVTWIRVTDVPRVHDRDEFHLLDQVPPLRDIGRLIKSLEAEFRIAFHRKHASIRTTLADAEPAIRSWVGTL